MQFAAASTKNVFANDVGAVCCRCGHSILIASRGEELHHNSRIYFFCSYCQPARRRSEPVMLLPTDKPAECSRCKATIVSGQARLQIELDLRIYLYCSNCKADLEAIR